MNIDITDKLISLNGERSVIGRAIVLHANTDDLGLGGNEESLKTGNAGARSGCGIIGASSLIRFLFVFQGDMPSRNVKLTAYLCPFFKLGISAPA